MRIGSRLLICLIPSPSFCPTVPWLCSRTGWHGADHPPLKPGDSLLVAPCCFRSCLRTRQHGTRVAILYRREGREGKGNHDWPPSQSIDRIITHPRGPYVQGSHHLLFCYGASFFATDSCSDFIPIVVIRNALLSTWNHEWYHVRVCFLKSPQ